MWLKSKLDDESGAALIMAILMLVLLTIIGISALNNTDLELAISGNDKAHKMTYYAADSGNELSKELIERAIENRGWKDIAGSTYASGDVTILNKVFWINTDLPSVETPSSTNRDAELAFDRGQTYLRVGANSQLSSGGAIQMAAGYEGVGKGAAGGGAWLIYDVRSRHEGVSNSQSQIKGQWRHVL